MTLRVSPMSLLRKGPLVVDLFKKLLKTHSAWMTKDLRIPFYLELMEHLLPFFKTKKLFPSPLAGCFALGSFFKCLTNVLNAGHISTAQCK